MGPLADFRAAVKKDRLCKAMASELESTIIQYSCKSPWCAWFVMAIAKPRTLLQQALRWLHLQLHRNSGRLDAKSIVSEKAACNFTGSQPDVAGVGLVSPKFISDQSMTCCCAPVLLNHCFEVFMRLDLAGALVFSETLYPRKA